MIIIINRNVRFAGSILHAFIFTDTLMRNMKQEFNESRPLFHGLKYADGLTRRKNEA